MKVKYRSLIYQFRMRNKRHHITQVTEKSLVQWILNLLKIPNPASFKQAFTGPFVGN